MGANVKLDSDLLSHLLKIGSNMQYSVYSTLTLPNP